MDQKRTAIEAEEVNVRDLLLGKLFKIPIYQRPFSWNEENFQELVDDIKDAMDSGEEIYFLGTVLLKRAGDEVTYEIVDGQQRLTSLIVLLAVFRDCLNNLKLQKWLEEEGDEFAGIPTHERIGIWDDLQESFSKYIYNLGGTVRFLKDFESRIQDQDKDSPIYHLYEAVQCFKNFFDGLEYPKGFLEYLFQKVYFVRIIVDKRSSAFRLFNVLNTRGLRLSAADVLKSLNLEKVPEEERDEYFKKWREFEEDLGREKLENVISYVRTIFAEEKAKKELVEEFEVLFGEKLQRGTEFFDTIFRYAGIYKDKVFAPQLSGLSLYKKVKYRILMDLMNRFLPFSEWIPPLLQFYRSFGDDNSLYKFAFQLERKFFIEWCADFTATERITSSINLIRLIKESEKADDVINKMLERPGEVKRGRERRKIDFTDKDALSDILLSKLDDRQFYSLKGGKMARYVLLRLDMEMQGENFPGYANIQTITVEHILPRSPQGNWLNIFSKEDIDAMVNKLGNLALLNRWRNSRASNYDFQKKKKSYFDVERNPFAVTTMLRNHAKWDKSAFEKRHEELLRMAYRIYISEMPTTL